MKNEPVSNPFLEASWRRKLSPEEELELRAWLLGQPEAQADWELEIALTERLNQLRDAPVSNNFTRRVLESIARERRSRGAPVPGAGRWWRRWLPRAAVAGVVVSGTLLGFQHHRRVEYARSVAAFSQVASVPGPAVLENFEAIRAMSQQPLADEDLLKALQ